MNEALNGVKVEKPRAPSINENLNGIMDLMEETLMTTKALCRFIEGADEVKSAPQPVKSRSEGIIPKINEMVELSQLVLDKIRTISNLIS